MLFKYHNECYIIGVIEDVESLYTSNIFYVGLFINKIALFI